MNARTLTEAEAMEGFDHQIAQLRVPPHSIEAESSVLGGLLLDASALDHVADLVTDSDFYRHEHRLIYAAIAELANANKQADVVTVYTSLESAGKADEAGGLAYLNSLAQYVPSASNIRRYAEIVRERAVLRKLVSASDDIATRAFNPDGKTVAEILDLSEQQIMRIGEEQKAGVLDEWEGMDAGITRLLDRISNESMGNAKPEIIPTGLRDLDDRLDGGMRPGDYIVLGARSGMGKSALAVTIGLNVALNEGLAGGMFSMEMSKAKLHSRMLSAIAGIHLSRINNAERLIDKDWPRITNAVEALRNILFDVNDQGGMNINQLRARARTLKRRHGRLGFLIIDHLQLITGLNPRDTRTNQLGEASRGLKSLAKELGCPIIALSQINRAVDKETDPMPRVADLLDCSAIEQDADVILLFDRPVKRKPDLSEEWKYYTKAHVAKLRDGEPGYINLRYIGENTHFMDWPEDEPVPSNPMIVKGSSSKGKAL